MRKFRRSRRIKNYRKKARLLGGQNRDRKEARRAKKWLQEPELRRRGEPERPESPNFPKFFPKKKMGGGKSRTGGNNIYTI